MVAKVLGTAALLCIVHALLHCTLHCNCSILRRTSIQRNMMYYTVQWSTAIYCTVQNHAALFYAALYPARHRIPLLKSVMHYTVQYDIAIHFTARYSIILYSNLPCYIGLYCAVL